MVSLRVRVPRMAVLPPHPHPMSRSLSDFLSSLLRSPVPTSHILLGGRLSRYPQASGEGSVYAPLPAEPSPEDEGLRRSHACLLTWKRGTGRKVHDGNQVVLAGRRERLESVPLPSCRPTPGHPVPPPTLVAPTPRTRTGIHSISGLSHSRCCVFSANLDKIYIRLRVLLLSGAG